jgi:hypothetical protein
LDSPLDKARPLLVPMMFSSVEARSVILVKKGSDPVRRWVLWLKKYVAKWSSF